MTLHPCLPLLPHGAREISDSLAILDDGVSIVFFNAAGPIYSCRSDDRTGIRLGAVTVLKQGLAGPSAVAEALSLHRTTLFRDVRKHDEYGVTGLLEKRRGPKGPHALTPDVTRRAQKLLERGDSIRATALSVGLSERGLRHAIQRGLLVPRSSAAVRVVASAASPRGSRERAVVDQACVLGVGAKREADRALAAVGKLTEAEPSFEPAEGVPGAGVLLALPALLHEGLLEVGTDLYGSIRNGFFGLRSILLTFAFMALLRIKTPEQLTEHAPGEFGILLGLDRAPEVKTLRRKLRELGERRLADTFKARLAERWAKAAPRELALLYVDGHVRPYNGRKHFLPRHHVQQRGRPMPGTKDFYVNDRRADPLLFVTAAANESLLDGLDAVLLPEIRRLVGKKRRVIVAFDREGWSPTRFAQWKAEGFDVLTYHKGDPSQWSERSFATIGGQVGGELVEYRLAERKVKLTNGLEVREIRRLTDDGHQTAVVTTSERLPLLAVAHRMFSRWRQENFFRYMRQEFAIDHLATTAVEPADRQRLVSHPERTQLEKELQAARAARTKLIERRLDLVPGKTVRVGNRSIGEAELTRLIADCETEVQRLGARIAPLPKKVPIEETMAPDRIVQLERERKVFIDALKLTAYRAESALARLLDPIFSRHDEESRKLLKAIFRATADIIPDRSNRSLTVRFHGLANPRATRALAELCAIVNGAEELYPGTDLRLDFQAPTLQK